MMFKDKSSANQKFYVLIFGIIFLISGIFRIQSADEELNKYKNSEKLTVVAEIKSIRFVPESMGKMRKPEHYDCLFEYYVDGHKIQNNGQIFFNNDKMLIEQKKSVGDKVEINILKDKNGVCTIAKKNNHEYFLRIGYLFIGIGVVAFLVFFIAYCWEYFASKNRN